MTDLDLRNDENRPSLTSSAVAERQDVSPKNTIDKMADAITWGSDIALWALWPANVPEKMREYWLKYETGSFWYCDEKSFFKHDVPQHRKDTNLSWKCATSLIRRQNHNGEVIYRSWLCFSPHTCRLMRADMTKCAHFPFKKRIFDWKHAVERLRSNGHSMEHIDATIAFSRRCNHGRRKFFFQGDH